VVTSHHPAGVGGTPYARCMTTTPTATPLGEKPGIDKPAAIAAGITVLLWASAFVGIRMVGHSFSPGALALGRLLVGAIVLSVFVLIRRPALPRGRDLLFIGAYGVLWFAGYNIALNAAEQHLDAGTTAVIVNVGPILIAVLSAVFLSERFTKPLVLGSLVAFAGVVIIATTSGGPASVDLIGVLLALLSAVLYACGVMFQKPALKRVDPVMATWLGCVIGAVVSLPFAGTLVAEVAAAPFEASAGLAYLGIFPTAIAFTTWAFALGRMSAAKLSASTYLVPAVAILLAWLVLSEPPTALGLVGGAVCLLGVALTRRRPRLT